MQITTLIINKQTKKKKKLKDLTLKYCFKKIIIMEWITNKEIRKAQNQQSNTVAPLGQLVAAALQAHKPDPLASSAPPITVTPLTPSKLSQLLAWPRTR